MEILITKFKCHRACPSLPWSNHEIFNEADWLELAKVIPTQQGTASGCFSGRIRAFVKQDFCWERVLYCIEMINATYANTVLSWAPENPTTTTTTYTVVSRRPIKIIPCLARGYAQSALVPSLASPRLLVLVLQFESAKFEPLCSSTRRRRPIILLHVAERRPSTPSPPDKGVGECVE